MIHLPPHIIYAALGFVAGILTGAWLERQKCRRNAAHAPAKAESARCPTCGANIGQNDA